MPWTAVVLIGPTGSGKTPLGQLLEREGLRGKRCIHFDFGNALRSFTRRDSGPLTRAELDLVRESLRTGALLENQHFPIAEKLLSGYLAERRANAGSLVVLNGIPRHIGQAEALQAFVRAQMVVSLECEPKMAWERIRINSGGDREGRADDTLEEVEQRIQLFRKRTAPLLKHYTDTGVPVLTLDVGTKTTAQEMLSQLEARWSCTAP